MRQPFWNRHLRWVVLGLSLSAAGGLGLVALASAHEAPRDAATPPRLGPPMGAVHGQPGALPGLPPLGGPAMAHLLEVVKATPDQRASIERIRAQLQEDLRQDPAAIRADREQWMKLLTAPQVDASAVEALRVRADQRHAEVSRKTTAALVAVSGVLTPAQRAQWGEWAQAAAERAAARGPERPERALRPAGERHHGAAQARPETAPGT